MRQTGCTETWTFEITLPALPPRRSFLIAAGLEQAVGMLEQLAENGPDLAGLEAAHLPAPLDQEILDSVASLRFTGSVEAVPEGTVIFAGEPVFRLRAPAPEAVLVGAALIGLLRSQTAVATKAARLVLAAGGKPVYEIGVRSAAREASLFAARSAYLGGACATANAVAAMEFGLPTMPVISLSLVAALGGMVSGLESCGVMVDGALASEGDAALAALSATPRAVILDANTSNFAENVAALRAGIQSLGWRTTKVLVGGRVDEEVIDSIETDGIEVDGFCVGGELVVAVDSPCIGFDYELVEREIDGERVPQARRDGGSGRRSVWRRREAGKFKSDTVQPESKAPPSGGIPLLVRVMEKGRRLFRAPNLSEVRVLCGSQISMLDPGITRRVDPATYTVAVTIEPKKGAPAAQKPEKAAPAKAPKGEPIRADEARRRALSQIDDSSDFSALSGAFESVVAANLGAAPAEESPVEPYESSPDGETHEEAANDEAMADEAPQEESPADEPAAEESTQIEESSDYSRSVEALLDGSPAEEVDPGLPSGDEGTSAPIESHDLLQHLAAEGLIDSLSDDQAPPKSAPAKRGTVEPKHTAPPKAPPAPKVVAPPKPPAVAKAVAAPKPVAPMKTLSANKPVAAAMPVAPPKPAAAARPVAAPMPVENEPPMPTFGNDPEPPPPSESPTQNGASNHNPLLVAAARLRSLQRGESLPPLTQSAPSAKGGDAPAPVTPPAGPAETSGNPLLAAAARLKSLRGS
jgi:nicotinate phosphoribosyltransferase